MDSNNLVLWVSLAVLMLALALWGQKRGAAARARAERARRAAGREALGGDSYFLPPAPIEQAVELANPVEIDHLLAGESETVAAMARRQLEEATTDLALTDGLSDLSLSVAAPPSPPLAARRSEPVRPPEPPIPAAPPGKTSAPRPASPAPPSVPPPATNSVTRVPVRELVLAWFEARGYRATNTLSDALPIELVLHHRKDQARTYAFVVERELVTAKRASWLLTQARTAGLARLLIAAEVGSDHGLRKKVHRHGIRIFDEATIRAELGKIDIRVAAKIIAVARGRALARRSGSDKAAVTRARPERLRNKRPVSAAKL
jgi:hypothetical protein